MVAYHDGPRLPGVVEGTGAAVTGFAVGAKVFVNVGLMPAVHDESWAELIVARRTAPSAGHRRAWTSPSRVPHGKRDLRVS